VGRLGGLLPRETLLAASVLFENRRCAQQTGQACARSRGAPPSIQLSCVLSIPPSFLPPNNKCTAQLDNVVGSQAAEEGLGYLTSQQALYLEVSRDAATQAGEEEAAAVRQQVRLSCRRVLPSSARATGPSSARAPGAGLPLCLLQGSVLCLFCGRRDACLPCCRPEGPGGGQAQHAGAGGGVGAAHHRRLAGAHAAQGGLLHARGATAAAAALAQQGSVVHNCMAASGDTPA
jgi:hypothetical protein